LTVTDFSSIDERIPLRIDSGCVSGQIYDDESCDCIDQLNAGLEFLIQDKSKYGLVIHIPAQDGRGFGTAPKTETEIYKYGGKGRVHKTEQLDTVSAAELLYGTKKLTVEPMMAWQQFLRL
jgi:GTP cyclohydrolase II